MSGAISNAASMAPGLLRGIDRLNAQNNSLTAQLTSGVTADSLAGLGDQVYQAVSLEPQITAAGAWQSNLSQTQIKLSASQSALSGISAIATSLQSSLLSLKTLNSPSAISTIAESAKQQLTALTSLLNTKSGDSYVFAGAASDQLPISAGDLASSSLVSSISSAVATVGTTGAAATEAVTLATASDNTHANSVFSAELSTTAINAASLVPQVQIGHGETMATGMVATQGGPANSQSTGSAIRDLIRSLATVAGFAGADTNSSGFSTLLADTSSQMQTVTQGLQGLTAAMGTLQDSAATRSSTLADVSDALLSQLNAAKDSDPAAVRTQQVAVQNQLTASYTLIADMKTLNLAQYI